MSPPGVCSKHTLQILSTPLINTNTSLKKNFSLSDIYLS